MRHIKIAIVTLVLGLMGYVGASSFVGASLVAADCSNASGLTSDACGGLHQVGGGGQNIEVVFNNIVNILSIVVGAVAVIVVVYSGFRYITSGGDSNKVSAAKNTLIYALVGVAVAALAQTLIHFVLHWSTQS
jgi:Type IV secretion system pilin